MCIRDRVNATKEETTIEKDNAIAVSLNNVPEIPSMNTVSYTHLTLPTNREW